MSLEKIGADRHVRELFRAHEAEGTELARVSSAAHEEFRVHLESGEYEAAPAGRLRWSEMLPAVGDWVAARRVDADLLLIEAVLPRRTQFARRAAGTTVDQQVIAANVDLALIVCGLDGDFNPRRMERYLVLARESGSDPVFILNKADLCQSLSERVQVAASIAAGCRIVVISAHESVEPLRTPVRDKTVVLLGSTGVGKSTIANGLLGEARQPTAAVRASDSRGRHTTSSRMLLPMPEGGAIIDTPGLRELQLWAGVDSLDDAFNDVSARARRCRFRDCTHSGEPGCAVQLAIGSGELDAARWQSYEKLRAELARNALQQDASARAAERRKWRSIHKTMRHHPKYGS